MLGIEIVDHDEIEIGVRGHLAGAEPAQREDRGLLAADAAVRGGKIIFHASMHGADQDIGKPGKYLARLFGRNRARQDSRTDQEHMLLAEETDCIENLLVARGIAERAIEFGLKPFFIGQRAKETRIDQRIDHLRILRKNIGEPRRDAEDQRDETDEFRILPQQ